VTSSNRYWLGFVVWVAIAGAACRERPAAEDGGVPGTLAPMKISADANLAFEYADLAGRFRRARGVAAVPIASRHVVRVIEPTVEKAATGDDRPVHVVDLSRIPRSRELTTRLMSRAEFERRALVALPPGDASRLQIPGSGPDLRRPVEWQQNRIIIYGTTWCWACKQAREFFRERGLDFEERNVELDPESAAELAVKAAALGIAADRVPVIDVRGRLLVGFDQARLKTLLGESV